MENHAWLEGDTWRLPPVLTDDSCAAYLARLEENYDPEANHTAADNLLCTLLAIHGYPKTVAAFEALDKWYA